MDCIRTKKGGKFPSPLGVIFSIIKIKKELKGYEKTRLFPSPLGVIFSLIFIGTWDECIDYIEFPSPLGVIFSLIVYTLKEVVK